MARAIKPDTSDSENESDRPRSTKKSASAPKAVPNNNNNNKGHANDAADENGEDDDDDDEEEEEEYEIESILDAKAGTFAEGRYGYLVKWKGYGEEHNSWVDEKDAAGAKLIIDEYWRTHKKGGVRKPEPKKPGPKPRKSTAAKSDDSDVEEVPPPPPKKRGRPSKATARGSDDEQDEDAEAPKKKPRKSTGAVSDKKNGKRAAAAADEEVETFTDMHKWKDVSSWEHLVDTIDTVERTDANELYVYFTLRNNKGHGRESSEVCKKKMPYKLIDFYESNLRWKPSDEVAMEE